MNISAVKTLSENDLGVNKSHQSGFLVPHSLIEIGLFEALSKSELNPRMQLHFTDIIQGVVDRPILIYYNNRFFGGTRNEYRITGISRFFKDNGLKPGDAILITRKSEKEFEIGIQRNETRPKNLTAKSWQLVYGRS